MNTISAKSTFKWKEIGVLLVGNQSVEEIDQDNKVERKENRMLIKWLEMEGTKATYRNLIGVFETTNNLQAAEDVKALNGRCRS